MPKAKIKHGKGRPKNVDGADRIPCVVPGCLTEGRHDNVKAHYLRVVEWDGRDPADIPKDAKRRKGVREHTQYFN